jgi:CRISPR/Cas system endoribonuclease Cas6 (RAMP superfamily)
MEILASADNDKDDMIVKNDDNDDDDDDDDDDVDVDNDANANSNANANATDDGIVAVDASSKLSKLKLKLLRPEDLLTSIPIGHPDSMMSKESVRRAVEEFHTISTDIIVSTFPKTGTTLVTWICHLLRTISPIMLQDDEKDNEKNNEDNEDNEDNEEKDDNENLKLNIMNSFDTIYELCPWPTLCWDIGYDPNIQGPPSQFNNTPRIFKSHLRMASAYKGCKYIVTVRDPGNTTKSFYNFFISKKVPFIIDTAAAAADTTDEQLKMDVSTFLMDTPYINGINTIDKPNERASIWDYYVEYHQLLDCPDVLILIYEDLVQDMPKAISQIGQFMDVIDNDNDNDNDNGVRVSVSSDDNNNEKQQQQQQQQQEDLISIICSMTTKEYMSTYMSKFDEPYERAKKLNRSADIAQLAPGAKIAVQKHSQSFNEEAKQFLNNRWYESGLGKLYGYNNYNDDFCNTIRKRNKKLFGFGF